MQSELFSIVGLGSLPPAVFRVRWLLAQVMRGMLYVACVARLQGARAQQRPLARVQLALARPRRRHEQTVFQATTLLLHSPLLAA